MPVMSWGVQGLRYFATCVVFLLFLMRTKRRKIAFFVGFPPELAWCRGGSKGFGSGGVGGRGTGPRAGLGGILVGPTGRFIEYFSYYLSPEELEILGTHEKETIIHECEMIAVSAALIKWESKVLGAQVIFCLDNDGTRTPYALGPRTFLIFGHGCSGDPMLLEHERHYESYYGLGLDALMTVCFWNTNMTVCSWRTNGIMAWAWMLW